MCLQCGCGMPNDDMGQKENLTLDDVKRSVETDAAKGMSTDEAIQNIVETWKKVKDEDKQYRAS
jgi:uncharacterized protein YoaH (UPF0181 family)